MHRLSRLMLVALLPLVILSATNAAALDQDEELTFIRKLYDDGLYEVATGQIEDFLVRHEDHPQRDELAYLLGRSYLALERNQRALVWLSTFAEARPEDPRACGSLYAAATAGADAGLLQQTDTVLDLLLRDFRDCEHHDAAVLLAARVKSSLGEKAIALQLLTYLIDNSGDGELVGRALYERAGIKGERDLTAATSDLQQLKATLPQHVLAGFASLQLAQQAFDQGEISAALSQVEWILKNFQERVLRQRGLTILADCLERTDQPRRAAAAVRELGTLLDPAEDPFPLIRREVDLLLLADRSGEAVELAGTAWESEGETARTCFLLGRTLQATGEDERAVAMWERCAELSPTAELGLRALQAVWGSLQERQDPTRLTHQMEIAGKLLTRLADDDERARILIDLGRTQLTLDRVEGARISWESVESRYPGTIWLPEALHLLAKLNEGRGNWRQAASTYRRLLRDHGGSERGIEARENLDNLERYYRVDQGQAIEKLLTILERGGEGESSIAVGRVILEELKDFPRAWTHFNGLVEVEGDSTALAEVHLLAGIAAARETERLLLDDGDAALWRERAERNLTRAAGLARGTVLTVAQFEQTLIRLTDLPEGPDRLPLLDSFLAEHPQAATSAPLYFQRAELYRNTNWSDQEGALLRAAADYDRVLTLAPDGEHALRARLALAHIALRQDRLEVAEDLLTRLTTDARGRYEGAEAVFGLGQVAEKRKRYREVLTHFRNYRGIVPTSPRSARCLIHIGDALYFLGEHPQARSTYLRIRRDYPESPLVDDAIYRTAIAEEQMGDIASSRQRLLWLLEEGSERFQREGAWRLAKAYEEDGDGERAVTSLEKLISLGWSGPHCGEGGLRLAEYYLEDERGDDALALLDSLISRVDLGDERPVAEAGRIRARLLVGEIEPARVAWEELEQGSALSEEIRARVWLGFGRAQAAAADEPQALESLTRCAVEFPQTESAPWALYEIALIDGRAGRFEAARQGFDGVPQSYPDSPAARAGLIKAAGILYSLGEYESASLRYEQAMAGDDNPGPDILYYSALALEKSRQAAPALERTQQLLALYPDSEHVPEAMMKVGYYLQALEQYERAILAYRNAEIFQDREGKARLHFWIGDCLEAAARLEDSLAEFLKVSYLYGDQGLWGVTATLRAAALYEKMGETRQAVQLYEKILANQGENSDFGRSARQALDRMAATGGQG